MNEVTRELGCEPGGELGVVLALLEECEQLRANRVRAERELAECRQAE
ncbi:MAG: hypothetical protein Q4A24_09900 [Akkermansia sp.]|nr:hypothetical protein [Akkermansia sp.]